MRLQIFPCNRRHLILTTACLVLIMLAAALMPSGHAAPTPKELSDQQFWSLTRGIFRGGWGVPLGQPPLQRNELSVHHPKSPEGDKTGACLSRCGSGTELYVHRSTQTGDGDHYRYPAWKPGCTAHVQSSV